MPSQWYFAREDRREGPVTFEELHELAASGGLSSGDLVWCEGMASWTPAREVPGLMPSSVPSAVPPNLPPAGPPPLPPTAGGVLPAASTTDVPPVEVTLVAPPPRVVPPIKSAAVGGPPIKSAAEGGNPSPGEDPVQKGMKALEGFISGISSKVQAASQSPDSPVNAAKDALKGLGGFFGVGRSDAARGQSTPVSKPASPSEPASNAIASPPGPAAAGASGPVPGDSGDRVTAEVSMSQWNGFGDDPIRLLLDGMVVSETTWPQGITGFEFESTVGTRTLSLQKVHSKDPNRILNTQHYPVPLNRPGHYGLRFKDRWLLQEFPSGVESSYSPQARPKVIGSPVRARALVGKWGLQSEPGEWIELLADGAWLEAGDRVGRFVLYGTFPTERIEVTLTDGSLHEWTVVSVSQEKLVLAQAGAAKVYVPWRAGASSGPAPAAGQPVRKVVETEPGVREEPPLHSRPSATRTETPDPVPDSAGADLGGNSRQLLAEAERLMNEGNFVAAIDQLDALIARNPKNKLATQMREFAEAALQSRGGSSGASAASGRKPVDAARSAAHPATSSAAPSPNPGASPARLVEDSLEITETDPKTLFATARDLLKAGRYGEALAYCNKLLSVKPGSKQALALRGKLHLSAAQYQRAIADLNRVRDASDAADRNLWLAYRAMGIECLTDGNYQQAIQYFDSTRSNTSHGYDEDTSYLRGLAYLEYSVQAWEEHAEQDISSAVSAKNNFDDMLADDPTFAPAFVGRGRVHLLSATQDLARSRGNARPTLRDAINDFTEAIKLDPEMGDAYFYRAEACSLWLEHGGENNLEQMARSDYQLARRYSERWAQVLEQRQALVEERQRLEQLHEEARRREETRLAEERRQQELARHQRIQNARSNAGVLSGVWNWLVGRQKCPQCGTRRGAETSSQTLSVWQEVRTDWAQAQGNYRPQAHYNVRKVLADMHCEACDYRWRQTYTESVRA